MQAAPHPTSGDDCGRLTVLTESNSVHEGNQLLFGIIELLGNHEHAVTNRREKWNSSRHVHVLTGGLSLRVL